MLKIATLLKVLPPLLLAEEVNFIITENAIFVEDLPSTQGTSAQPGTLLVKTVKELGTGIQSA